MPGPQNEIVMSHTTMREDGLQANEEWHRVLVEHSPDAMLVVHDGCVRFANPSAVALFHAPQLQELLGRTWVSLIRDGGQDHAKSRLATEEAACVTEEKALALNGATIDIEVIRIPIRMHDVLVAYFVIRDISARKHLEARLRHQAIHDPLTGLPNRAFFLDHLTAVINASKANQGGSPFATAFIDLDCFKRINDNYGHHAGDLLLQITAQRIQSCLRKSDVVTRLGGDEFVLLLHDCGNKLQLVEILDRILECIAVPILLIDQELVVTCSIGCCNGMQERDAQQHLIASDSAMYRAKKLGGNQVQFFGQP